MGIANATSPMIASKIIIAVLARSFAILIACLIPARPIIQGLDLGAGAYGLSI
jgi:hypothetical protein